MTTRSTGSNTTRTRRRFVGESIALAAGGILTGQTEQATAQAATEQAAGMVTSRQLVDTLTVFTGPDGTNSLVADAPDGLIMIDGGHSDWADALLAGAQAAFPSRPFAALVNTHWHPEQTGCNLALGERGVEILAHENTRLWLGVEIHQRWSGQTFAPLPPAARPTTGFHASHARQLAGLPVAFSHMLHAHTDGDIAVYLPDENVLVTGGHVSNAGWPIIDWWTGGWIGGLLDGFDTLAGIVTDSTRIVPSRGPVMTPAEFREQHAMYLTIFDRLQTMLRGALSPDEVIAERPTAEFDARYGDSELFLRLAFESMWGHLRDAHDTRLRNIA